MKSSAVWEGSAIGVHVLKGSAIWEGVAIGVQVLESTTDKQVLEILASVQVLEVEGLGSLVIQTIEYSHLWLGGLSLVGAGVSTRGVVVPVFSYWSLDGVGAVSSGAG